VSPRSLLGLASIAWLALVTPASADDDVEPYARIVVEATNIRSGPGASFRRVYVAERGEEFPILGRATRGGYWFKIELPDATSGWVMGETVYVHEVGEGEASGGRFLPWLFAPPPLLTAVGELSVTMGVLGKSFGFDSGRGGFMAVRPAFYLNPVFGIEATGAASVAEGGRIFFGTLGGIVNLFPRAPIVPYAVTGAGFAFSDPNADTFLLEGGNTFVLYGGGGLRFGFRYRLIVRVEARAYAFYKPDVYVAQEELSGGVTVFF